MYLQNNTAVVFNGTYSVPSCKCAEFASGFGSEPTAWAFTIVTILLIIIRAIHSRRVNRKKTQKEINCDTLESTTKLSGESTDARMLNIRSGMV